jgi:hypothetical protein
VADAGYWHHQQMDELAAAGVVVLSHRTRRSERPPGRDGTAAATASCERCSPAPAASSTTNATR